MDLKSIIKKNFKSIIKKKDSKIFIEELKHFGTNSQPNKMNQTLDIAHYSNNEFLFGQQNEFHRNYGHVMNSDISVNPNSMRFNEMPFVAEFDVSNNKTVTTDKMSLSTTHSIEQLNRKSFKVKAEAGICEKNKQFITLNLQCFNTGCPLTFNNKIELKLHMFNQHGINQYRCLEKNCKQSFTNSNKLGNHIRNDHSSITQWNCDKCPKYFATHHLLYMHNYLIHQLGQYKCSFLNCLFASDQKQKIQNHYKSQHQFSGKVQSLNFGMDADVQQQNKNDFDPSIFVETILVENPLSLVFNSETLSGINGEFLDVDVARINNDEKVVMALDLHMLTQHNLNEYRCFVNDCKQSFIDENKLSNHIKKDHTKTSKLSCEYKCTFPKCEFLNEQRKQVQNHNNREHKIVESKHQFSGRVQSSNFGTDAAVQQQHENDFDPSIFVETILVESPLSLVFNSETLSGINGESLDVDVARINNVLKTPHSNEKMDQNSFEVKEQEEYYKVGDQILILRRQCFYTGCSLMFNNKSALYSHMLTQHGTNEYCCFVKDCKQSFINQTEMSKHIKDEHTSTSKLSCEKCSNKFSAYHLLRVHHYFIHQLGEYKCTFPECGFLDEQRKKVQNHYSREHNILELTCQYGNCGRRFNDQSNFKRHKLTHKNNKNSYI